VIFGFGALHAAQAVGSALRLLVVARQLRRGEHLGKQCTMRKLASLGADCGRCRADRLGCIVADNFALVPELLFMIFG